MRELWRDRAKNWPLVFLAPVFFFVVQVASIGYVAHPLAAYEKAPIWTADPKNTPYRDCVKNMRPTGYAGKLGYASAGAGADFIVANMVAEAASGARTPKEAAERAQKRAERYYKV